MFNRLVRFYSVAVTGRMQVTNLSNTATEAQCSPSKSGGIQIDLSEENTFAFGGLITGCSHEWRMEEKLN